MPMHNAGGRIAINTARHSAMVSQPSLTVHRRKDMLPTAATPVMAWTRPSALV